MAVARPIGARLFGKAPRDAPPRMSTASKASAIPLALSQVASGVVLLGEELTATKILGGVIILLGVYLARRR